MIRLRLCGKNEKMYHSLFFSSFLPNPFLAASALDTNLGRPLVTLYTRPLLARLYADFPLSFYFLVCFTLVRLVLVLLLGFSAFLGIVFFILCDIKMNNVLDAYIPFDLAKIVFSYSSLSRDLILTRRRLKPAGRRIVAYNTFFFRNYYYLLS